MKKLVEVLQEYHPLGRETEMALLELVQLPEHLARLRIVPAEIARKIGVDSISVARAVHILTEAEVLERKTLDEGGFYYTYSARIRDLRRF